MRKNHHDFSCRATVYLDGFQQGGTTLRAESRLVEDVHVGNMTARPFTFGILNLTGLNFVALQCIGV
jgi:hypothetical protein